MKSSEPVTTPGGERRRSLRAAPCCAMALAATAGLMPAAAEAHVETTEVWTDVGVRVVPLRRLRLTFTQNVRFSTMYGLRRIIPELEADYRVIGPLRIGGGYRYLWRDGALGDVEEGHLIHGDVMVQLRPLRHLDIELRSRVQWRSVGKDKNGFLWDETRDTWRNRVNVEWTFRSPFTVNAFVEHWARFDDTLRHDRFRVGAGISAEVSRWRFQLFYMRDMPDFIDNPNVNMVGLSARLELDLTHR